MAFHLSVRAERGCLLFRTHAEARALWDRLATSLEHLLALCLMPNHTHIVSAQPELRLAAALSGFARWRNHARQESGAVFEPHGEFEALADADHLRRTVRYVHLNPCRKGLVGDPLAWPWSTHRDAVGFAFEPAVARRNDVGRFHRYVSADPSVAVEGTELPRLLFGDLPLDAVAGAVAGVCRVTRGGISEDRRVKRLAVQAAWYRGFKDLDQVAAAFGCGRTSAWRWVQDLEPGLGRIGDPVLRACVVAAGDPRFGALPVGDLRGGWGPYRSFR